MEPRLEGADPDAVPPYMTEPPGPGWSDTIRRMGHEVEVEVRIEHGKPWMRQCMVDGRWSLWRGMAENLPLPADHMPSHDGEPAPAPLLTAPEHAVVAKAADLWNAVCAAIPDGPTRDADLRELIIHVHAIQHAFMAQAAARAYPDTYRLLGGTL